MYRKFGGRQPFYEVFGVENGKGIVLSVMAVLFDREELPTVVYLHGNGGHKM